MNIAGSHSIFCSLPLRQLSGLHASSFRTATAANAPGRGRPAPRDLAGRRLALPGRSAARQALYNDDGKVATTATRRTPTEHLQRPAQRRVRLRHRAYSEGSRRLEYAGPDAVPLRRRRLVSARLRLQAQAEHAHVPPHRRGQLPFHRLGEPEAHLRPRRRLYSVRLRGDRGAPCRQQLRRHRRGFHAAGGRHSLGRAIDWFNYGGLTRDVSLVTVPSRVHRRLRRPPQAQATFSAADATTLTGYVHVRGRSGRTPPSRCAFPRPASTPRSRPTRRARCLRRQGAATLELWSPQTPKLYKVELASGEDTLTDDIGFRDIRVDGTRILLNGKPIFLQGANMHAEAPVPHAAALTPTRTSRTSSASSRI